MKGQLILAVGVASVGATLGYMVGGSGSPVISVAVPAIFALVVTALGVVQASQPSKELFDLLKSYGEKADALPELADFRERSRSAPRRIGICLIVFSVAYISAATFGAKVRIDNLLVSKVAAPAFPWSASDSKPPTIAAALDWIALQRRLRELGYDDSRIKELYDLQVRDWNNGVAGRPGEPTTPEQQPASGGKGSSLDEFLKKFSKEHNGNPFVYQPPPNTLTPLDRLKTLEPGREGDA